MSHKADRTLLYKIPKELLSVSITSSEESPEDKQEVLAQLFMGLLDILFLENSITLEYTSNERGVSIYMVESQEWAEDEGL